MFFKLLHHQNTAAIILLASLVATGLAWDISKKSSIEAAYARFVFSNEEVASAVSVRMKVYEQILRGGVGLFQSSSNVTREEWRSYYETLNLTENFSGFQGFGFSKVILPSDLNQHVAEIRAEGFPNYAVLPSGQRELYTSVIFLEPFDSRNIRAFGFDMYSEPIRREAMASARASGRAVISRKVKLLQETDDDKQFGVLMYVPVFREHSIYGFVFSPFRMNDLMSSIVPVNAIGVSLEVFEDGIAADKLLFQSPNNSGSARRRTLDREIVVAGRRWILRTAISEQDFAASVSSESTVIAIGGLIINFLLFLVLTSLGRRHQSSLELTQRISNDLNKATAGMIGAAKLSALGEMAGGIAHEINNPLTILSINTGDIIETIRASPCSHLHVDVVEKLRTLERTTFRIAKIIKGLKSFSRDGAQDPVEEMAIVELVDDTLTLCFERFRVAGVELNIGAIDPRLRVICRSVELSQVLLNLLNNAFDAILKSSNRLIRIDVRQHGRRVEILVSDNGPGIAPEIHGQIFNAFYSTKQAGEGTGLGLYISKGIVERYGGSLTFTSSDQGTIFKLALDLSLVKQGQTVGEIV